MRLLIITQVIDKNHPILGFFHRWVEFFAKECDSVEVICLQVGEFDLPENVTVHSLGKEEGGNKIKYLWRFFCLLWKLGKNYDDVFVHMNPVYVVLAGWWWRLFGKVVGMWYTHGSISWSLRLATWLTDYIFSASRDSFPLSGRLVDKKVIVNGHGIDINRFLPQAVTKDIDLLTVGRLSPSKNLELLLMVLKEVQVYGVVRLAIVGSAATDSDQEYVKKLKEQADSLGLTDLLDWVGPIPNEELPDYLKRTKVFLHASKTGSLDKTLLEALLVDVPVVTSATGAKCLPLDDWHVTSPDQMAKVVGELLQETPTEKIKKLRKFVVDNHSLQNLIPRICDIYKKQ